MFNKYDVNKEDDTEIDRYNDEIKSTYIKLKIRF